MRLMQVYDHIETKYSRMYLTENGAPSWMKGI